MEVRLTYKYKLYHSKKNKHLHDAIDLAADIWNHCIALHRRYYKLYGKHLSANKLKVHITKLKRQPKYAYWNELGSQAIQDVVERIDRSYKAFFDRLKSGHVGRKSPPHFQKRCNYASFTLKQAGYRFHDGNHITILGRDYKYAAHRPLDGAIKTVTVKRNRCGDLYLCVSVLKEIPDVPARTGNAVGMDFGLKTFLALDTGDQISSPQFFKTGLKTVQDAHRAVSRCQKGSNNRKRAIQNLDRQYAHIANQRRDWFFKLANMLVDQYAVICIEDLNLDGMKRLWGRKVSDLAYAEFVSILQWTAKKNGTRVLFVPRYYASSKTCHACGYVNRTLTLNDRSWDCPECGIHHDRDVNAALNIRNHALSLASA